MKTLRKCVPKEDAVILYKVINKFKGYYRTYIDDLVSHALIGWHIAKKTYNPKYKWEGYLYTVAKREIIDNFIPNYTNDYEELQDHHLDKYTHIDEINIIKYKDLNLKTGLTPEIIINYINSQDEINKSSMARFFGTTPYIILSDLGKIWKMLQSSSNN